MVLIRRVWHTQNPDKTYFPTRGETKMDLVNYYVAIEEPLMAAMRGRPLLLQRFPEGATGKSLIVLALWAPR